MPSEECPQCHAPLASAMGKTFCPHCGWNRTEAEKQTRFFLRLLPVLVILFDAPLIAYIFLGHAETSSLALLVLLAIVPAILVVIVMRRKVRVEAAVMRATQIEEATDARSAEDSVPGRSKDLNQEIARLEELQRPRAIRMSRQGKMSTAIITISLLVFAVALIAMVRVHPGAPAAGQTAGTPRGALYVIPLSMMTAVIFFMRRALVQQKWLLSMGEVAPGRVTRQWTARNGNGIRYEFTTPTGETISRSATDASRQYSPGMSVPVFYDPMKPKRQVALCASFYEVAPAAGREVRRKNGAKP